MSWYRIYSGGWSRTGYATEPQYPGQEALARDFPEKCPECGTGIVGCGMSGWLHFRGWGPAELSQPEFRKVSSQVAWCVNQHLFHEQPVEDLLA